MMKNLILGICFLLVGSFSVNAQTSFTHGAGVNYLIVFGNGDVLGNYGFEYSPRINFMSSEDFSISLGTHLTLNGSLNVSSRGGSNFSYFVMLPALAGVNIGSYSSGVYSGKPLGGYLEGGYAIAWTGFSGLNGTLHGPMAALGMRFDTVFANEIGVYYMKPANAADYHALGFRIAKIF